MMGLHMMINHRVSIYIVHSTYLNSIHYDYVLRTSDICATNIG